MECKKCGNELYRISGLCTDREGIREDAYCPICHIRYGVRSHGLEKFESNESKITNTRCKYQFICSYYQKDDKDY